MKRTLLQIFSFLVITACTNDSNVTTQKPNSLAPSSGVEITKDSIDIHGVSGCIKHSHPNIPSFIITLDSMWQLLAPFDNQSNRFKKFPIEDLKKTLEINGFSLDNADDGFKASKREFNERFYVSWNSKNQSVELLLIRWVDGGTHEFVRIDNSFTG